MNLDRVIAVRNAKTIYRDGDMCVKVFNEYYSKADILNEALNQARIEETGLHIPKILGVTMIEGKWAILSEFIPGKTLSQLMKEDPDNKSNYLNQFVDIQMEVHSKTCPMLNRLKDKMRRKISQADLDATTRYDLHARLEGMPTHSKVCHGDFWPSAHAVRAEMDAHRGGQPVRQGQRKGEGIPAVLGQRGGVSLSPRRPHSRISNDPFSAERSFLSPAGFFFCLQKGQKKNHNGYCVSLCSQLQFKAAHNNTER